MRSINFSELAAKPEQPLTSVPRGTGSMPAIKHVPHSMTFADAAPLADVPEVFPASLLDVVFDAKIAPTPKH